MTENSQDSNSQDSNTTKEKKNLSLQVKMSNDVNNQDIFRTIDTFTEFENNFFYACLAQVYEQHDTEITFSSLQMKRLIGYSSHISMNAFVDKITRAFKKYEAITQDVDGIDPKGNPYREVHTLFRVGRVYTNDLTVHIQVDKPFINLFNDLEEWTRFSLLQYTRLHTKYIKRLYRVLKQYRTTGWKRYTLEEFREALMIPKSYESTDINKRILNPAMEDLASIFQDIKVVKLYQKGKRGRRLGGYEFQWKPEARNRKDFRNNEILQDSAAIYYIRTNPNLKTKQKFRAIDRYRGLKLGTTESNYKNSHPKSYFLDDNGKERKKRYMFSSSHLEGANRYSAKQLQELVNLYESFNKRGILKEADMYDLKQLERLLLAKKTEEVKKGQISDNPPKDTILYKTLDLTGADNFAQLDEFEKIHGKHMVDAAIDENIQDQFGEDKRKEDNRPVENKFFDNL